MSFKETIKSNPRLKKIAHRMMVPKGEAKPRFWLRLLTPFIHKIGKGVIFRRYCRLDVFPYNKFEVGSKSIIEGFSTINNGVGDVIIGNNCGIGLNNTIIGPVKMGNYVMLAQNIVISGLNHGFEDINTPPRIQKVVTKQITIEDDVWIGANCTVTAGVTIGKHAVIGAGSVVTKDIPQFCVAVGNPARVIKKYNFETNTWGKI